MDEETIQKMIERQYEAMKRERMRQLEEPHKMSPGPNIGGGGAGGHPPGPMSSTRHADNSAPQSGPPAGPPASDAGQPDQEVC